MGLAVPLLGLAVAALTARNDLELELTGRLVVEEQGNPEGSLTTLKELLGIDDSLCQDIVGGQGVRVPHGQSELSGNWNLESLVPLGGLTAVGGDLSALLALGGLNLDERVLFAKAVVVFVQLSADDVNLNGHVYSHICRRS